MKKILSIFAGISLITAGTSSVVACGSHHITKPPKSESQKLFDELNETKKPFLIKNDYFWGNEANYQNDLLVDLEKAAHITSQEDKNLLNDPNVKPLTQQYGQTSEVQSVDINIDGIKDPAIVKIKWELTEAQKPIYTFYTQYWPQYISQATYYSGGNLISYTFGQWEKNKTGPKGQKGWWEYDEKNPLNSIYWNTKFYPNQTLRQILEQQMKDYVGSTPNLSPSTQSMIQSMVNIKPPSSVSKIDIDKTYTLPKNSIYLLSHGIKYPLSYYASYDVAKALPKPLNWQINYNTMYNLMQNELKNDETIWYVRKAYLNPKTTSASDPTNAGQIKDRLQASKYSSLTSGLTFSGNIKTDGTKSPIEVYYGGVHQGDWVDQGFPIYVATL